jgi:proteic killer suppression protein
VIRSFRHAGLEAFFRTGSKAGIQPKHAKRLRLQLGQLNRASGPRDMAASPWRLHPLYGGLKNHWAVWVD